MSPGASRSPDTRVYRAALWLCPSGFRREFADEMVRDFDDAHSEVTSMGARDMWPLRLVMAVDLVRTAGVQWARTGLPVIAVLSLTVALALAQNASVQDLTPMTEPMTRPDPADPYAQLKPCFASGIDRIRVPVAAKIALHTAGSNGGMDGSPKPVGELLLLRKCTSISVGT
jgi:hypothetical protein